MRLQIMKGCFTYVKPIVSGCLFLFITMSFAMANELSDVDDNKETDSTEIIDATTDDSEAEVDYHIHKKDNPDDPCDRGLDSYSYEESWYDETQAYINSRFCEPALWFDNFFASDRVFDEGVAGTYVRWRHEFTQDEEEYFKYKMRLSASVELPIVEEHLRLTFEGDEDEDLRDIAPGNGEDTANSLGLQLDLVENTRSKFNVSVSLSPRVRLRYRYTYPIYQDITLRLTQEAQRKKSVHTGRTQIDFEKVFKYNYLFRASTEGKVSEEFDGVDWLQAFVLYQRVDHKTSLSYESSVTGITEPRSLAINYRLGFRYRKNFHRRWLFFEIAPEVTWPVTLNESRTDIVKDRRSKWLLFFRLEVHFGNASKKRYEDHN